MASSWQKFWRWALVMELVALGVALVMVANMNTLAANAHQVGSQELGRILALMIWATAYGLQGLVGLLLIPYTVAMLLIVEGHAFVVRRRRRGSPQQRLADRLADYVQGAPLGR